MKDLHLIGGLPEEKVSTLLATARALSTPRTQSQRSWPPAFFGSIKHASNDRMSATLENEADPTLENEATGS